MSAMLDLSYQYIFFLLFFFCRLLVPFVILEFNITIMYGAPERYKLQRKLEQQKNPHMDLAGKKEREQDIAYVAALIYTCSGCLLFLFYKSRPCSIRTMASANSSAKRFV